MVEETKDQKNPDGIKTFIKDAMGKMGKEYSEDKADKLINSFNGDYDAVIKSAAERTGIKDVAKFRDVIYEKYGIQRPTLEPAKPITTEKPKIEEPTKKSDVIPKMDAPGKLVSIPGTNIGSKLDEQPPEPKIDTKAESTYLQDIGQSLLKGATSVSQGIVRLPSTIYRIAALPQNLVAKIPGLEGLEVSKDKNSNILNFLDENKITEYYDDAVEQTASKIKKYEQSATEQWKTGDRMGALKTIGVQAAESIPLTALLMVTGGTGAVTEGGIGIGAYSAGQKLHELDRQNPDMSEVVKVTNAIFTGAAEAGSEAMSMGSLGIGKKLLYKEGQDGLKKIVQKSFIDNLNPKLAAFYNIASPMIGEGLTEAAAQYSENYIDRITGAKTDGNLMDGVMDAFLIGTVAGGVISAPISTYNEVVTKPEIRSRVKRNLNDASKGLENISNTAYADEVKKIVSEHTDISETTDKKVDERQNVSDLMENHYVMFRLKHNYVYLC